MRQKQWPPLWLTYTFMLVSILLSGIAWLVARHILNDFLERRRIAAEENQALLVRLHHVSTVTKVNKHFCRYPGLVAKASWCQKVYCMRDHVEATTMGVLLLRRTP